MALTTKPWKGRELTKESLRPSPEECNIVFYIELEHYNFIILPFSEFEYSEKDTKILKWGMQHRFLLLICVSLKVIRNKIWSNVKHLLRPGNVYHPSSISWKKQVKQLHIQSEIKPVQTPSNYGFINLLHPMILF